MDKMEEICFGIISNVGMAKSLAIESLRDVRTNKYDEALEKIQEAENFLLEGHSFHTKLLQEEAAGNKLDFSLILMHAEDQLMSAETIKDLAKEMIELYKSLKQ